MKHLALLLVLALGPTLSAQTPGNTPRTQPNNPQTQNSEDAPYEDSEGHRRFWQASFPAGQYIVALDRISSISQHKYLLDGNLIITEVTIDTVGDSLLRVYHIEPAAADSQVGAAQRLVERGNELLERAGQRTGTNLHEMVQKQYPTTTHSKTVEYRVRNLGTLGALFRSVENAWKNGRGRNFRVRE